MKAVEHLDQARRQLRWSVDGLWSAYAALGGVYSESFNWSVLDAG